MSLVKACKTCSTNKRIVGIEQAADSACKECSVQIIAYNRYYASNIPIEYWKLEVKDFKGVEELVKLYDEVVSKMSVVYQNGYSFCIAGGNGIGKTSTATSILKKAAQKNYTCLYTTLSDIVSVLIDANNEDKFNARKELMSVDWLVVDEFDPKYISAGGADLFGRSIEPIIRTRMQNHLPTLFNSNSPNPVEMFSGTLKVSIDSLFSKVKIIPVFAKDHRKMGVVKE